MSLLLQIVVVWFLASIPVGIATGKALRKIDAQYERARREWS